jgi:hypothetical protein
MDFAVIERSVAVVGGILVAFVSAYALYKDWKTPGLDNQVFKVMLFLLAVGAVLATLAGLGILGNFPKAA